MDDKLTDTNMNGSNDGGLNAASMQAVVSALMIDISKDGAVLGIDEVMEGMPPSPKPGSEGAMTSKSVSDKDSVVQEGDVSCDVVM